MNRRPRMAAGVDSLAPRRQTLPMKSLLRFVASLAVLTLCSPARAEPAARELFGAVASGTTSLQPAAVGAYAKGCLAGGVRLAETGTHWQAVRLSRNRNWGHPVLVRFLTTFAAKASASNATTSWPTSVRAADTEASAPTQTLSRLVRDNRYSPSISSIFWTAAPDAPLPRLSSLATSTA